MPQMQYESYLSVGNNVGEFVRSNTFEVYIEGELNDICPLHVVSCSLPLPNVEPIEVPHFNVTNKVAGKPTFDNVELVVRQTFQPNAIHQLWNWMRKVFDPETGQVGYAADYKRTGTLNQYDQKGVLIASWTLYGIWPSNVSGIDHNYDGAEPIQVTISMSVDYAKMG